MKWNLKNLEKLLNEHDNTQMLLLDTNVIIVEDSVKSLNNSTKVLKESEGWHIIPEVFREYKSGLKNLRKDKERVKAILRRSNNSGKRSSDKFKSSEYEAALKRKLKVLRKTKRNAFQNEYLTSKVKKAYRILLPEVTEVFKEFNGGVLQETDVKLIALSLSYSFEKITTLATRDGILSKTYSHFARRYESSFPHPPEILVSSCGNFRIEPAYRHFKLKEKTQEIPNGSF